MFPLVETKFKIEKEPSGIIALLKGYLRYKTITSQNVPSKVQINNCFIS